MKVSLKTKDRVALRSTNPTPGNISVKSHNSNRYIHHTVSYSTVYNSQDMEVTKMSTNIGMDEEDMVHIYSGI